MNSMLLKTCNPSGHGLYKPKVQAWQTRPLSNCGYVIWGKWLLAVVAFYCYALCLATIQMLFQFIDFITFSCHCAQLLYTYSLAFWSCSGPAVSVGSMKILHGTYHDPFHIILQNHDGVWFDGASSHNLWWLSIFSVLFILHTAYHQSECQLIS